MRTPRDERPLSAVPAWIWIAFGVLGLAQVGGTLSRGAATPAAQDLPPAPKPEVLRAVSLGDGALLARLTMLWLQAYDHGGANSIAYRNLDYARLIGWLRAVMTADPRSDYALFSAARIYAENPDPARSRLALAFIHEEFLLDPDRRWPWLAHASLLAKHRLRDLPLARRYAADVARLARSPEVPDWARQMEVFVLEDMNELDSAKVLLGAMLAAGRIRDPEERRFLELKLQELEQKAGAGGKR